ncbi:MAG: integration host factor subunit alpha [Deltaproteobacteria bacterium]|nr:integration host factor subunit alpha [Deltaproteobacteria bacterium]
MTLTKERLVESVNIRCGHTKVRSKKLVETLFEIIKRNLESGESVLISRFGKFSVKDKSERRGRNPSTGNDLVLGARRVVTFKCAPFLKDKINKNT